YQGSWTTLAIATVFDPPSARDATEYEAQATVGDSGGAVFVKRNGEWLLAGMMTSVTGYTRHPARTSMYGDTTYAADLSVYRSEILHWARPACSNEEDDDGDDRIDFAGDPGCDSLLDASERDQGLAGPQWPWAAFAALVALAGFVTAWRRRRAPVGDTPVS
ncbi:hypothetical protein K2X89_09960, partial [Myxococcota bacterium]|nr:hypothetical protein [Myxococcota bacterium]